MTITTNPKISISLQIIEAQNLNDLHNAFQNIPGNATIFFDIDDTIIAPISSSFHIHYSKTPIDQLKEAPEKYNNFGAILSAWRLSRKIMLVCEGWPNFIDELKKSYPVYGLTKMNTGAIGILASTEIWREQELRDIGITFTQNKDAETIRIDSGFDMNPAFYKGLLFTGSASKSDTINCFNKALDVKFIVMVDDRLDHLENIAEHCKDKGIGFLGVHFKGATALPGLYDPELAEFQKEYLIKNLKWLEDEEARILIKK